MGIDAPRSDPDVTFPVAEYGHEDPVLGGEGAAITGVHVYRADEISRRRGRVIFGDNPIGEVFHIDADDLPDGGEDAVRRIHVNDDLKARTFLALIRAKNAEQGRPAAERADLRFGSVAGSRLPAQQA